MWTWNDFGRPLPTPTKSFLDRVAQYAATDIGPGEAAAPDPVVEICPPESEPLPPPPQADSNAQPIAGISVRSHLAIAILPSSSGTPRTYPTLRRHQLEILQKISSLAHAVLRTHHQRWNSHCAHSKPTAFATRLAPQRPRCRFAVVSGFSWACTSTRRARRLAAAKGCLGMGIRSFCTATSNSGLGARRTVAPLKTCSLRTRSLLAFAGRSGTTAHSPSMPDRPNHS